MARDVKHAMREKIRMNRTAIFAVGMVEILILAAIGYIAYKEGFKDGVYNVISLGIILLWIGVVIGYLAWAVYFYNINYGKTNHDWAQLRKEREENPGIKQEGVPNINPHAEETLGLPPGSVRGILAISLLVGGLSLFIASLGMSSELKENQFLIDNFEFFKTAFLMMIAFYFGDKALKHLNYSGGKVKGGPGTTGNGPNDINGATGPSEIDQSMQSMDPSSTNMQNATGQGGTIINVVNRRKNTNPAADGTQQGGTDTDFEDSNAVG